MAGRQTPSNATWDAGKALRRAEPTQWLASLITLTGKPSSRLPPLGKEASVSWGMRDELWGWCLSSPWGKSLIKEKGWSGACD